jgi:hypothetical protein
MSLILSGSDGLSDIDGTAATPAIRGTDANTGIFFGSDIIGFSEDGTEVARFNADAQFVAAAGTALLPVITTTGDVNTGIFFPAADTIAFSEGGTEQMRITSTGLLQFNSGYGSVATAYGCRAWVNFNGTGTPAIRASGNVSSITDNGVGDYTVNFTNAFVDANYAAIGTATSRSDAETIVNSVGYRATNAIDPTTYTTTAVRFINKLSGFTGGTDSSVFSVAVFR